jgi:hypothetical protein
MSRADGVVNGPAESDAVLGALPRIQQTAGSRRAAVADDGSSTTPLD